MLRRLFIAVATMAAFVFGMSAQTQKPYFGARLSMDITVPGGGSDIYSTGAGFTVGGICNIPFARQFYFEPGIMFSYMAMSSKDLITFDDYYYYQGAAKQYGIRVPLNFGYRFEASDNLSVGVFTGPWLNFNISAKQALDPNMSAPQPVPDKNLNLFKNGWRHVDLLWGFGVNFTFAGSYEIGLSGGVSVTPLARYGNKDKKIRIHRNVVAITLGYNF